MPVRNPLGLGPGLLPAAGHQGIVYLLRDEFTTPLAAGSVNGTLAEPGPGTRVVADANLSLSIAGGLLDCNGGGASANDPSYYFTLAVAREAGRLLVSRILSTDQRFYIGWDDAPTGRCREGAILFNAGAVLSVSEGGVDVPIAIGTYTDLDSSIYEVALVLRVDGYFAFIRGVEFPNWTLLWPSVIDNTTPVYAGLTGWDSTSEWDYMRVPEPLWLPVPLLSDSFNRANGALGNTDGAGHAEANGGGGVPWVDRVGTTQIATNVASASALVGGIAIATANAGNVNVLHEAKLTRSAGNVGIVVRYADTSNYVYAYHEGTNALLVKVVAGTPTTVITAAATYAAGAVLRVMCDGTSFALYYNNAAVGTTQTISDAGLQTGTEHGLYSSNVGNSQDNMVTWARKIGYSKLDKF